VPKSSNIIAENVGPIAAVQFSLSDYGVTVLVAPNGSGKSILLDAVSAAARGAGKVPLRDHAKKGRVEAFGAKITLGGTTRHTGEFEVENLEGRFDLSALVDPGLKTAEAADAHRVKALVALTGVQAKPELFRDHEAFADWDAVIRGESLETDDLCEMARRIKVDYDTAARKAEADADKEDGFAQGLDNQAKAAEVDLTAESDAAVLQERYNSARDTLRGMEQSRRVATEQQEKAKTTRDRLEALKSKRLDYTQKEIEAGAEEATKTVERCDADVTDINERIAQLQADKQALLSTRVEAARDLELWQEREKTLAAHLRAVREASVLLEGLAEMVGAPSDENLADAKALLSQATEDQERGVLIRNTRQQVSDAAKHREKAAEHRRRAEAYREAGRATDAVLSDSIKCPTLRIESDGKAARLVTDTARGNSIPYHELSDGERWTIAIDLGAEQVGEGGLLVIPQVAWEGIDGKNRKAIHKHAKTRKVYILTAEKALDPDAEKTIKPAHFSAN
jgi:hypothetical protein